MFIPNLYEHRLLKTTDGLKAQILTTKAKMDNDDSDIVAMVWNADETSSSLECFKSDNYDAKTSQLSNGKVTLQLMQSSNFPPLVKRILEDGRSLEGGILKVDGFINHQLDPVLLMDMANEFARRFCTTNFTKIMTIEASGIAPAVILGYILKKPVVFAKKKKPSTMDGMLVTEVHSFTKNQTYQVCVSAEFLNKDDKILFIDDFLANGKAALGIIDLCNQAGAEIVGMGFLIEKSFQKGGELLRTKNIHVESLATISSLDNCTITLA